MLLYWYEPRPLLTISDPNLRLNSLSDTIDNENNTLNVSRRPTLLLIERVVYTFHDRIDSARQYGLLRTSCHNSLLYLCSPDLSDEVTQPTSQGLDGPRGPRRP